MKVLLVSPLPPPIGGIATWTKDYVEYYKKNQYPLVVVNSAIQGDRVTNVEKVNLFSEIKRTMYIKKEIKKKVKSENPNILHYNASCSKFGLIRDYLILHSVKIPVFFQCHCNLDTQLKNKISIIFFKKICKKCKNIGVLNKESENFASLYSKNVYLTPNFIKERNSTINELRENIQKVCFVGRAVQSKGILEYIEVAKDNLDINFNIIGPITDQIVSQIKTPNVKCLGPRSNEEVLNILKDMDVYILPSYSEGFPLGVLESMQCGLPIIATKVGAIPDMIENKGGILVSIQSVDELNVALETIKDIDLRKKMSVFNINKVKNNYNIEIVLENFRDIYMSIIKSERKQNG